MKRHIPNTITCCNLVSGCIAVTFALMGNPYLALLWIIMGAVFDFFDGMSARLLGVSSPIGKELDSLADVVTFGVAPSAIVYYELGVMDWPAVLTTCCPAFPTYIPYFAFVMAAFSALRLAKFNLDERQTTSFIGLPTPANALFWGSLIVGGGSWLESSAWCSVGILLMLCVSSWLLVAELPMFALKFKHWGWKGNEVKYIFVLSCIPLLLFFGITAFAFIIAWYVVLSVVVNFTNR
ncbi:MAG: CDP-diacylglycerol--serine O-phosphatidyltransferase [Prevotella sp.]|nr:CDP-diacylglycerol--serine O-phosphatidyltransferase [Prevotella sp.]